VKTEAKMATKTQEQKDLALAKKAAAQQVNPTYILYF